MVLEELIGIGVLFVPFIINPEYMYDSITRNKW